MKVVSDWRGTMRKSNAPTGSKDRWKEDKEKSKSDGSQMLKVNLLDEYSQNNERADKERSKRFGSHDHKCVLKEIVIPDRLSVKYKPKATEYRKGWKTISPGSCTEDAKIKLKPILRSREASSMSLTTIEPARKLFNEIQLESRRKREKNVVSDSELSDFYDRSLKTGDRKSRGDGNKKRVRWNPDVDIVYFSSHLQSGDPGEVLGRTIEPLREEWQQTRTGIYAKGFLPYMQYRDHWVSLMDF